MRIWSIHPKYLDSWRLTGQWRDAFMCKAALEDKTHAYDNTPEFLRVKNHPQPFFFIDSFLYEIWKEANQRGYSFDRTKLPEDIEEKYREPFIPMEISEDDLEYEFNLLQKMLPDFDEFRTANVQYMMEEGILPNDTFLVI